jgi:ABC-2 type transport system permease protein
MMKELFILFAPVLWSIKNDIIRFNRPFYKKVFFYTVSSGIFIFLFTKLLSIGMTKLQNLSTDVFNVLLIKGYSLIFIIIFFIHIVNGLVISLNTYYQSKELEVLLTSPVNRTSLFFSRLFETHIKASWMLIIFGIPLLVSSGLLYHTNPIYYIYSLSLFIAFSTIPVNIGISITIFLSSIFCIRKLKKFLLSTGIVIVVLSVTMLRIFKPERFVNPELFANLTLFISEIKTPSFILLPNRWLSESLFNFLSKSFSSNTLIFISLLFLTSYITTVFLQIIFKRYYYRGWGVLQEGDITLKGKRLQASLITPVAKEIKISKFVEPLMRMLNTQSRMFIKKDLLYQIRDVKNIHQIFILLLLIIVYLFSIASLPLNWEYYAVQLKYIISFFNLGLILIIIASLCSRLVYPAVISEETSLWIIKTSPMTPKRYIWTKFLLFFIPIFILGQLLITLSSFFIGIEKAFILLKIITTTLLTFSLVSLAIVFSISDLKHTISVKEQPRAGSTAYMLISVFLIFFTLALEIIPVFLYFLKEARKGTFTQTAWIAIGAIIFVLFLVNLLVTALSIHLSMKKIDNLQLSD